MGPLAADHYIYNDLDLYIFSFLSIKDISSVAQTCKHFSERTLDDRLWKIKAQEYGIFAPQYMDHTVDWKMLVKKYLINQSAINANTYSVLVHTVQSYPRYHDGPAIHFNRAHEQRPAVMGRRFSQ